ncbi:hypothetical protein [Alkalihalobacterium sp. APHAB7]|uniref:hypothetical protein n=1 Tax=Alkalihalobacterium sp. APHAB7 TaxID=3402081 RepID=UPI003AAD6DF4
MRKRTKAVFIFVTFIVFIYAIFAVVETVHLSSKTVEGAFEKFINNDINTEGVQNEIGDKEFYQNGNYTFVPFVVDDNVSLVQFEKGIFGWKRIYYSHNRNEGLSYSTVVDELKGDILIHGVIPKEIVTQTKIIQVNGIDAEIILLNDISGIWILLDNKIQGNFGSIQIEFLDEFGNVIAEM